eukprot:Sspe_Gene.940::Locus_318_Transcript_1_1_Confidence_1.000_Length_1600::g.940::m.940
MRHVRIMWRVPCCASCTGRSATSPLLGGIRNGTPSLWGARPTSCHNATSASPRGSGSFVLRGPALTACCTSHRRVCADRTNAWPASGVLIANNVHICRQRFGAKRRPSSGCTTPKQHSESDTMSIPCLSPADKETFRLTPPLPLDGQDDPIQPLPPVALMPNIHSSPLPSRFSFP